MKLPDLNIQKYIGDSERILQNCTRINQIGDIINVQLYLHNLPGNLGKYFSILGTFNSTSDFLSNVKPRTVIIGADIKTHIAGLQYDFIESFRLEESVVECKSDIFGYGIFLSIRSSSVQEVFQMIKNKFENDLLLKMIPILARREPLCRKEISIVKNGVTLFIFQTYWFEDKVVFNIQNYSDFDQTKLNEVIIQYGLYVDKYNNIYKDAYKLYDHFEKISYSSENISDIMVKIFDSVIVHIDNSCLIVNDQESVAISTDNYQASEGQHYGFSNIIGKGYISMENIIEAAKKSELINIGREFTHYIGTLLPK